MPTRLALRGFIHGGTRYKRNDPVTADAQTIEKMAATGLVGKQEVHLGDPGIESIPRDGTFLLEKGEKVIDTSTTSKTAKPPKAGKKSSASPAAQASTPPTLPPLQPGVPPPLPDAKSSS